MTTAIRLLSARATVDARKTPVRFRLGSVANKKVATCVLSPSSARKTLMKTAKRPLKFVFSNFHARSGIKDNFTAYGRRVIDTLCGGTYYRAFQGASHARDISVGVGARPFGGAARGPDSSCKDAGHLRDRCGGRQLPTLCFALRRIGSHRYGECWRGGGARRGSHRGRRQRCRPQTDRSPDYDSLPWRPCWRPPGARETHTDSRVHRSWTQRPASPCDRSDHPAIRDAEREGEAQGREAWRQDCHYWSGLARRDGRRRCDLESASWCGRGESLLRGFQTACREPCLGPARWQYRRRTVCRQPRYVRQVPCLVFG